MRALGGPATSAGGNAVCSPKALEMRYLGLRDAHRDSIVQQMALPDVDAVEAEVGKGANGLVRHPGHARSKPLRVGG